MSLKGSIYPYYLAFVIIQFGLCHLNIMFERTRNLGQWWSFGPANSETNYLVSCTLNLFEKWASGTVFGLADIKVKNNNLLPRHVWLELDSNFILWTVIEVRVECFRTKRNLKVIFGELFTFKIPLNKCESIGILMTK